MLFSNETVLTLVSAPSVLDARGKSLASGKIGQREGRVPLVRVGAKKKPMRWASSGPLRALALVAAASAALPELAAASKTDYCRIDGKKMLRKKKTNQAGFVELVAHGSCGDCAERAMSDASLCAVYDDDEEGVVAYKCLDEQSKRFRFGCDHQLVDFIMADAPTCSPTAAPSSLPSSAPSPSTQCFTGNLAVVKDQCGGKCCVGGNGFGNFWEACDWSGTATICKGGCVGPRSCENLGEGVKIQSGSCLDTMSCYGLTGGAEVKEGSCTGTQSCQWASSSVIKGGSCLKYQSCYMATANIGENSCRSTGACYQCDEFVPDGVDLCPDP